jgi:hypothetical protein
MIAFEARCKCCASKYSFHLHMVGSVEFVMLLDVRVCLSSVNKDVQASLSVSDLEQSLEVLTKAEESGGRK